MTRRWRRSGQLWLVSWLLFAVLHLTAAVAPSHSHVSSAPTPFGSVSGAGHGGPTPSGGGDPPGPDHCPICSALVVCCGPDSQTTLDLGIAPERCLQAPRARTALASPHWPAAASRAPPVLA